MKKAFLALIAAALLFCSACGSSAEQTKQTMEGVYSPNPISHGYRFTTDGIVQYYETREDQQWKGCDPAYWYGTYTLEGNALTIRISGASNEIWGVVLPEGQTIINGELCEVLPAGYYTNFSDNTGWSDLDKELGLS